MKGIRRHLSFANVVACLALFVALGGVSYAAVNLPKNSVGSKQLKKGAVRTNDISAKAVKAGKIAKNAIPTNRLRGKAVKTGKIAPGAVTGAKIDAPSTPFSQVVANLGGSGAVAFQAKQAYPLAAPTYTQPVGRTDQYVASMDVTFSAACAPPRSAVAGLLLDSPNPLGEPLVQNLVGYGGIEDAKGGDASFKMVFGPYPGSAPWRPAPAVDTPHTFSILMINAECKGGAGVTATAADIDVIGTKQ